MTDTRYIVNINSISLLGVFNWMWRTVDSLLMDIHSFDHYYQYLLHPILPAAPFDTSIFL